MRQNILILTIGIILIFLSLFLFTRPVIFDSWDFSDTGQIGDTIGGVTAPIINLIGAFLVYISFKAQIDANKIQKNALDDEKIKNKTNRIFEKHLALFDDIKNQLKGLEFIVTIRTNPKTSPTFIVYKGINALNEYVLKIEDKKNPSISDSYSISGQFLDIHFMFSAILDLLDRIDMNVKDSHDKKYLESIVKRFYCIFLNDFGDRIINSCSEKGIEELIITKQRIDEKLGA